MSNVNHVLKCRVNSPTLRFAVRSVFLEEYSRGCGSFINRGMMCWSLKQIQKKVCPILCTLRNNGRNSRSFSNPFYSTNQFSYHKRWHKYGKAFRFFEQTHGYGRDHSAETWILLGLVCSISWRNCNTTLSLIINRTSCTFKIIPTMLLLSYFAQKDVMSCVLESTYTFSWQISSNVLSEKYPGSVFCLALIWTFTVPLLKAADSKTCG